MKKVMELEINNQIKKITDTSEALGSNMSHHAKSRATKRPRDVLASSPPVEGHLQKLLRVGLLWT